MLSRDFYLTDVQLTTVFSRIFPEHIPSELEIVQIPKEITS